MNPSLPATMQAVQQDQPNGPLVYRQVPLPRPGAGQVLVRMAAAPINPSDLGALGGNTYGTERRYPFTPGIEGSGTVVAAGAGLLPRLLVGRRVACSSLAAGTWAEYMLTSAQLCAPLNGSVNQEQGSMLLVNPLSAIAIFDIARRGRHRAIVSTAAASALGQMLLALGVRRHVPVIHIVRRQEQVDLVRQRGGEYALDSSRPTFRDELREAAGKLRATLLLDAIGGSLTQQLAEAAPYGSTLLLYSRLSDQDCVINPVNALTKNLTFQGWFLANWVREQNLLQVLRLNQQAQSLLKSDLGSMVQKRFPLAAAQQALDTYTHNMTAGKVLLVANPNEVKIDA
jgi:NADPH:quinone reductase-like Zn-dependent oxidoreductase